jgi:bifunctional DNA-binding transcriptional regulator/antitoxin component of YhaV-PrlF toxin-antitoxin module
MSYTVKLSKKNQGAIPVDILRYLGLEPNQENVLVIYQNINGEIIITTSKLMIDKLAGSLGSKVPQSVKQRNGKLTADQLIEEEYKSLALGRAQSYLKHV